MDDPSVHEAHDLPLATRLVDEIINRWLQIAYKTACATVDAEFSEYERGKRQGYEEMRWLYLADHSYTVTPKIIDALRRAGK